MKAAHARGLILPIEEELNWSGKSNGGQHVEFERGEQLPFQIINTIGMSLTATVDKVRCRRIMLARKSMTCGRRLSVQDALTEVEHLQKLRHPHIIQLVGSYLQGKKFAVLLYPVADSDLSVFLEEVLNIVSTGALIRERTPDALAIISLWTFLGCLSEALMYIHSRATKHLDIKPGNILIKRHPSYRFGHRVYIADFGISRSFPALDRSQTDTPVPRTPKYCAPEVWNRETHGRSADIFSLGCVFLEMLTTLCGRDLDEFTDFRTQGEEENTAYQANLPRVYQWAEQLRGSLQRPIVDAEMEQFSTALPSAIDFGNPLRFQPDTIWLDTSIQMLAGDPAKRVLSWVPLNLNDEICSSCDGVREVYQEETVP
jgi:serine/threonine protein kinase